MEANTSSILETFKADLDKLDHKHQAAADQSTPATSSSQAQTPSQEVTEAINHNLDITGDGSGSGSGKKNKPVKRVRMSGNVSNLGEQPNSSNHLINRKTNMPPHDAAELENLLINQLPIDQLDLLYVPKNCAEQVELFAKYVWENGWKAMPHHALPNWLRDNDFLLKGHRPPLPSIKACFKSIFRIHTETGNIWTHFIGAISFMAIASYFLTRPNAEIQFQEKIIFGTFFMGAIICLLCSALFHTFYCYSPKVCKLFNKIDYAGISVLTMGSFVPWLYYAFYCEAIPKIAYLILISILGIACIIVSLWDKFSEPQFRAIRAGMFIGLGLSGVIPAIHYIMTVGSYKAFNVGALGWLILMAVLYIVGACLYAARIPERLFPGKFDIWFQSHQIFHVFVVVAAYVHYHGITRLASYRLTIGDCLTAHTEADFSFEF